MNNISKDKTSILQKVLLFLLSFYFSFAVSWNALESFNILAFLLVFGIVSFIMFFFFSKVFLLQLKKTDDNFNKKEFILYGFILLVVFIISFFSFGPALMSPDSFEQWRQAQSNNYSNWHPVIHTLLFFKLPSLFYNHPVSCTIFQLGFIGLILLYFCYFLRKNFLSKKQTFLVLLLIVFNPSFMKMSMYLWKDLAFSWTVFLGTLFMIELVLSKGNWIDKRINKFMLVLICLGVMLFRHNGIVSVILLLIVLAFVYRNKIKFYLLLLLSLLIFRFALYGPIYNCFDIGKTGGKSEMLGVVSAQIAHMYHNDLVLSLKDKKMLNELAPKEKWESKFDPVNFNNLKWDTKFNPWAEKHFNEIMNLWLKTGVSFPKHFIISYINITSPIWKIYDYIEIRGSNIEHSKKFSFMDKVKDAYNNYSEIISSSPLKYIFFNFGMALFVIILSLFIVIYKAKNNFEKYIPFVLVLSNTMVIMLLITGGEVRFVYSQIICALPLLIYSLYLKEENKKKNKKKKNSKLGKLYRNIFIEPTENSLLQFIRYGFVGAISAVVNIGMLYIFTDVFGIYYIVSNILSFTLGLIVNYILSKKTVFTQDVSISKYKEFIIYAIIGVIGLLFDTLLLWLFTDKLALFYLISKILSTFIVFIWNFGARKVLYKIVK